MEYSLQAIYYLLQGYINLLLQMEVVENVTVGGILFACLLISGLLVGLGLFSPWVVSDYSGRNFDGSRTYAALPDHKGKVRGDGFTMR